MDDAVPSLQRALQKLIEVHADERGVRRVITPLTYAQSEERIVIRVRPVNGGFCVDENGDTAFLATLNGGNMDCEAVAQWSKTLQSPLEWKDEVISTLVTEERLVAQRVFRVAESAHQLYTIAMGAVGTQVTVSVESDAMPGSDVAQALYDALTLPPGVAIVYPSMQDGQGCLVVQFNDLFQGQRIPAARSNTVPAVFQGYRVIQRSTATMRADCMTNPFLRP